MDAKQRYENLANKIHIKCPRCRRVFEYIKWDTRTRQGFNNPNSTLDIVPISETFKKTPANWAWYTCPGCEEEINSNELRIINFNETIEDIEPK